MRIFNLLTLPIVLLIFIQCKQAPSSILNSRWSEERAWEWKKKNGWMVKFKSK